MPDEKDFICVRRHHKDASVIFRAGAPVSSSCLYFLFTLPSIKHTSGNLAESRYRLRHGLFPWLTQNIFWHIFSTGSCGRGGQRGLTAKQAPWDVRVPTGTPCLFPPLHYHLPPFSLPFHLRSIAGSKLLSSGNMVNRGGRLQTERERIWEKAE